MKTIGNNLLDDLGFLIASGMIHTALENTAAVAMSSNSDTICPNSIEDELRRVSYGIA